ncbi:MAG: glutamate 5-kinase [Chloroflexi bacterium]|nr:glutamate 5-kinase [Chloroflexota bacterium]
MTNVSNSAGPSDSPRDSRGLAYRRIVVKVGTGVLTDTREDGGLNLPVMEDLVRQICSLKSEHLAEIILVTSGAIAAGRQELRQSGLHLTERDIPSRQALAAIGQGGLIHAYHRMFESHGVHVAQALLTINDLADRQPYLNVRNTLTALMDIGVVPILNENDVVAVDEIGAVFGDNDRLSALVTNLVDADLLIILTDTEGLYTADPFRNADATLIPVVEQIDEGIQATVGQHRNPWARGGMPTKIDAARLVTSAGIAMIMCSGRAQDAILQAAMGNSIGTLFQPSGEKLEARKRWMLNRVKDSQWGEIQVDGGAAHALLNRNVSLLPAGVRGVRGDFHRGDIVYIVDEHGRQIACGIANYAASDIARIRGFRSDGIAAILGYQYGQEVVHRNNLVLI